MTVAGKPSVDLPPGRSRGPSAGRVEGTDVSGYAVIIEQGEISYGAYAPDLPGLGVAGDSVEEVERLIREAIPLHIESLRAHGEPVPPPTTVATAVIPAPADLPSASPQA